MPATASVLTEGDEIALDSTRGGRMNRVHVGPEPLDAAAAALAVSGSGHGATVTFAGTVRDFSDGRGVVALEYSAYAAMALRQLGAIVDEASVMYDGASIVAAHRTGPLQIGDVAVVVAAAHAHRAPAFDACRYVIEEIKKRVPIWKREQYVDGTESWVDPTAPHRGSGVIDVRQLRPKHPVPPHLGH